METSRRRELWRHRETGEAFLVELEEDRVVSGEGPLDADELDDDALAYKQAASGRSPAFTGQAAELERRRDEFDREARG
jgi:hypothetical protein